MALEDLNEASYILESNITDLDSKDKHEKINRNSIILSLLQDKALYNSITLTDFLTNDYHNIYNKDFSIYEEYFIKILLLSKLMIKDKVYKINPELKVRLYSNLCLKYKKKLLLNKLNLMKRGAVMLEKSPLLSLIKTNYLRDFMPRNMSYELVDERVKHEYKFNTESITNGGRRLVQISKDDFEEDDLHMYRDKFINNMWKDMFNDDEIKKIIIDKNVFSKTPEELKNIGDIILNSAPKPEVVVKVDIPLIE